jgi:hypothetical protein
VGRPILYIRFNAAARSFCLRIWVQPRSNTNSVLKASPHIIKSFEQMGDKAPVGFSFILYKRIIGAGLAQAV